MMLELALVPPRLYWSTDPPTDTISLPFFSRDTLKRCIDYSNWYTKNGFSDNFFLSLWSFSCIGFVNNYMYTTNDKLNILNILNRNLTKKYIIIYTDIYKYIYEDTTCFI